VTPNSDWWDCAKVPPRPEPIEIRKRERLCTLRKGGYQIALDKRDVPVMGDELIVCQRSLATDAVVQEASATRVNGCDHSDDSATWGQRLDNDRTR
jgi:hypothetical protein